MKNGSTIHANALAHTGAEASLIWGNANKFKGAPITILGLGLTEIHAKQTKIWMNIEKWPKWKYSFIIVPIPEYIIGIDILQRMSLKLTDEIYNFAIRTILK